jgi:hypothetical protein
MSEITVYLVDLSDGTATVQIGLDHAWGGLSAEITRARDPAVDWDGNGDRVLLYGPGADRRSLAVRGTTYRGKLPPDLSDLDLDGDITATLYWSDGVTTTTLTGGCAGIDSAGADLLASTVAWSLGLVGVVTVGLDPVTGITLPPEEPPA